ncbi:hypothetical protein KCP75_00980 [Salmonella enterica subsp. enterica]|nr:hypothetical protein KCP75_00980 [Salmonella enterica subsp. enterica]
MKWQRKRSKPRWSQKASNDGKNSGCTPAWRTHYRQGWLYSDPYPLTAFYSLGGTAAITSHSERTVWRRKWVKGLPAYIRHASCLGWLPSGPDWQY